jgi:hypothetical protein
MERKQRNWEKPFHRVEQDVHDAQAATEEWVDGVKVKKKGRVVVVHRSGYAMLFNLFFPSSIFDRTRQLSRRPSSFPTEEYSLLGYLISL